MNSSINWLESLPDHIKHRVYSMACDKRNAMIRDGKYTSLQSAIEWVRENETWSETIKTNDEWIKSIATGTQNAVYEEAYAMMAYRKAYYNENITVDDAITKLREIEDNHENI